MSCNALYLPGVVETMVALVLWEHFKKSLSDSEDGPGAIKSAVAAGGAKLIATSIGYPHG